MGVIHGDGLGAKIGLAARPVKRDGVDLVSAVAGSAYAAGIRQHVGEQLISPTGPIIVWISRELSLHVRSRVGGEYRGTDENKSARGLAGDRLAQDIHSHDLNGVER